MRSRIDGSVIIHLPSLGLYSTRNPMRIPRAGLRITDTLERGAHRKNMTQFQISSFRLGRSALNTASDALLSGIDHVTCPPPQFLCLQPKHIVSQAFLDLALLWDVTLCLSS
jgi:hypothetical protein